MSIRVEHVSKSFSAYPALDDVSLTMRDGEFVALLGPSGSGKTTLLRILAGLEVPEQGRIWFGKRDVTGDKPASRGIGFVFQHYALFGHMTVEQNIAFGLDVMKRAARARRSAISPRGSSELLELVQLPGLGKRYPSQLSGGQRQRVALARALARNPRILLLDEPFGALDAKVRRELRGALRQIHDELGLTSIFVTHDQEEAFALADPRRGPQPGRIEQFAARTRSRQTRERVRQQLYGIAELRARSPLRFIIPTLRFNRRAVLSPPRAPIVAPAGTSARHSVVQPIMMIKGRESMARARMTIAQSDFLVQAVRVLRVVSTAP